MQKERVKGGHFESGGLWLGSGTEKTYLKNPDKRSEKEPLGTTDKKERVESLAGSD